MPGGRRSAELGVLPYRRPCRHRIISSLDVSSSIVNAGSRHAGGRNRMSVTQGVGPVTRLLMSLAAGMGILLFMAGPGAQAESVEDRKSTRLNSSHMSISYAVFC